MSAIKFDEITVTFHPNKPSNPVIISTEKKQLLMGTKIQINFLKTYHRVAIIKIRTPNPCLLYTSPSPRDAHESRMPSSA